jgi:hypothetical protein
MGQRLTIYVKLVLVWAVIVVFGSLWLPSTGSWTIDDEVKLIAARQGLGVFAESIPDGDVRSRLEDPSLWPPIRPPFASRIPGGFAVGFSPWSRALFKLLYGAGFWAYRLIPALVVIGLLALFERRGLKWAFLLMPLTFYGLVPWEHALSWLLLWPSVWWAFSDSNRTDVQWRSSMVAGVMLTGSVLLRPETSVIAVVVVAFSLWNRRWNALLIFCSAAAISAGLLFAWQRVAASQPALVQINLNLLARSASTNHSVSFRWLEALYGLLLRMDLNNWASATLLSLLACGSFLILRAQKQKTKAHLGLGIICLALWFALYTYRLWSAPLPTLALRGMNSLFAALPWVVLLLMPPYRKRPAFLAATIATVAIAVLAPIWEGVHWGPRLLLGVVPFLILDLYHSGRARGWAFTIFLILTAAQTANSALLIYARARETAIRNQIVETKSGSPIICPTMSQCMDLAPLWNNREFFTAYNPRELRQLLIELRFTGVDTVWLHLDARDSLYVLTFPTARPVWPHHMTLIKAHSLYTTWWRLMELVINRNDSLWAGILEGEAGQLLLEGHPEAALRLEREAVTVTPEVASVHSDLALILSQLGQTGEAREEANRALGFNADLEAPRRLLEMLEEPPPVVP